jgi:hypothetical protein
MGTEQAAEVVKTARAEGMRCGSRIGVSACRRSPPIPCRDAEGARNLEGGSLEVRIAFRGTRGKGRAPDAVRKRGVCIPGSRDVGLLRGREEVHEGKNHSAGRRRRSEPGQAARTASRGVTSRLYAANRKAASPSSCRPWRTVRLRGSAKGARACFRPGEASGRAGGAGGFGRGLPRKPPRRNLLAGRNHRRRSDVRRCVRRVSIARWGNRRCVPNRGVLPGFAPGCLRRAPRLRPEDASKRLRPRSGPLRPQKESSRAFFP